MFLDLTLRRNRDLIEAAINLHASNKLPPNTYVIDIDALRQNSAHFVEEASRLGMRPFAMTKQIGRNPDVCHALVEAGITHCVGVDLDCSISAYNAGMKVGHLGHLVQIPRSEARIAAALKPEFWTVFNLEKAREASLANQLEGRTQRILARVVRDGDKFYAGHEGGVDVDQIVAFAEEINLLPNLEFSGITTFPASLFDTKSKKIVPTPNRATLQYAKELLEDAGFTNIEVNAPGTTSSAILESLAIVGVTQVEPGHGLTGTTPAHAVEDLAEIPAMIYVSEVSHIYNGEAYVFGGGLYVDPVIGLLDTRALLVGREQDLSEVSSLEVKMPLAESIDYYARIPLNGRNCEVGDTVIFAFRPQVFVTRANTAALYGASTKNPQLGKIWSADGSPSLIQQYF